MRAFSVLASWLSLASFLAFVVASEVEVDSDVVVEDVSGMCTYPANLSNQALTPA